MNAWEIWKNNEKQIRQTECFYDKRKNYWHNLWIDFKNTSDAITNDEMHYSEILYK